MPKPGKTGEPPDSGDVAEMPLEEKPGCKPPEFQEVEASGDRPRRPISSNGAAPYERLWRKPGSHKKSGKSADLLFFPGGDPAASKPGTLLLPVRSKVERAKLRIDLGSLRGELLAQQIDLLDRHQQRLEEYGHLLGLCLAPQDHLALDGLSDSAREARIVAVQRAALSQLLPTRQDTLGHAIKVLTVSLLSTVELRIRVADLARASIRKDDAEDIAVRARICEFDTPTLRRVHEAMVLLTGQGARAAGPPKPPPPDPIDDLP